MDEVRGEDRGLLALESEALVAGSAAGLVAAVPMGVTFQLGTDILPVLGSFLGAATALRGWIVHLLLGLLYGAAFAAIVAYPPIHSFTPTFGAREYVLVGVTYAVMVAAVTIGVLPFVLRLPWATPATEAQWTFVPGLAPGGLLPAGMFAIAHIVYGAVLGAAYDQLGDHSTDADERP